MNKRHLHWQNIIEQWHASGLGPVEYCRQNNITPSTFYQWRQKLRGNDANTSVFKPVEILPSSPKVSDDLIITMSGITITIPQGSDNTLLANLLQALGVKI